MTDFIGTIIDRYQIIEKLGEGGMAAVYKAYDTRLERQVAFKIMRTDRFPPVFLDNMRQRFEREAKSLAQLTHPSIVPIIDYGTYTGDPFLVMAYLPGGTLKDVQLRYGKLPWSAALHLLMPLAEALQYSHEHGILHRDVKPSNILLTKSKHPMLTDFGLVKLIDIKETHTLTSSGVAVGTPEYMSPEQGIGKEVDERTDVYGLGVVLYELLTGLRPYQADTPAAVLIKQVTEPLPNPRDYVPDLPEPVVKVLFKALEKDKEDRYHDIGDMKDALLAVLGIERSSKQTQKARNSSSNEPARLEKNQLVQPEKYEEQQVSDKILELYLLAESHIKNGDYHLALQLYQQSLSIAGEAGDRAQEAWVWNVIARLYSYHIENPKKALYSYNQAAHIYREIGEHKKEVEVFLNDLGEFFEKIGDSNQALEFYQKALSISREVGEHALTAKALNKMGEVFLDLENYDSSFELHLKALSICRKIGNHSEAANALGRMSLLFMIKGDSRQAELCKKESKESQIAAYQQHLADSRKEGRHQFEIVMCFEIINLLLDLGREQEVIEYLRQVVELEKSLNLPDYPQHSALLKKWENALANGEPLSYSSSVQKNKKISSKKKNQGVLSKALNLFKINK